MSIDKIQLPDHTATNINWDAWLKDFDAEVKKLGYHISSTRIGNEDFCYCKTIKGKYLLVLMIYDFRKFADRDPRANRIGLQYQVLLSGNHRIDMIVSKHISVDEFEAMAGTFYEAMKQYL